MGSPRLTLDIKADQPVASLVARLCDIRPDGASSRISFGVLNLCHRAGHEAPDMLEPGRWYQVTMLLDDLAQAVPAGHSLRLALSTSYWPMIWPAPKPVTLSVRIVSGVFEIPIRPPSADDEGLRPFGPPASAPGSRHKKLQHLDMKRRIDTDLTTNEMTYTLKSDGG